PPLRGLCPLPLKQPIIVGATHPTPTNFRTHKLCQLSKRPLQEGRGGYRLVFWLHFVTDAQCYGPCLRSKRRRMPCPPLRGRLAVRSPRRGTTTLHFVPP